GPTRSERPAAITLSASLPSAICRWRRPCDQSNCLPAMSCRNWERTRRPGISDRQSGPDNRRKTTMAMQSSGILAGFAWALAASTAGAADVTYERLASPGKEPQNWLMNHRDYGAHRYSPLDAINKSNVKSMRLLFAVAIGGSFGNEALEATPLVEDGFMYVIDG